MKDSKAKVIANKEVARDTYLMELESDLPASVPGQFVMVKIETSPEPFLRRPLAILHHEGNRLELLYKIKGKGTIDMSGKKEDDVLFLLGPLGKGFSDPHAEEEVIYIAGGTGIPPVMALAGHLRKGRMIVGARSEADLPLWDRMSGLQGIEVQATTEDGSLGRQGLATDALEELLNQIKKPCVIYACGPNPMLKTVSDQARRAKARCEVSLEEYMGCGFGVCSACAVKTTTGNQRVCIQGPVFDAAVIRWNS